MSRYLRGLLAFLATALLTTAAVVVGWQLTGDDDDPEGLIETITATPGPFTPTATSTPSPTATPSPTPTPVVIDAESALAAARSEIEAALAGIPGEFGLAVIDLPSGAEMGINQGQPFYPASAGKIIVAIAVLRQVQAGLIEFEPFQDRFEQMILVSSDEAADEMDLLVSETETRQVLQDAGASEVSSFPSWRQGFVAARDLALVWKGLVEGGLLDGERTQYLVGLTSRYEMDPTFETFPVRLGRDGYLYGQKAGYNIQSFPHTFVGAGYTVAVDLRYGFVAAFILHTEQSVVDSHEQRTTVYPIIARHLLPPD
ncbi:MAG: hypothetical protein GEU28_01150 [Dehalococcoidia bacterium]|nr:hypothetical protein [Dehalococcoidia bacterium]